MEMETTLWSEQAQTEKRAKGILPKDVPTCKSWKGDWHRPKLACEAREATNRLGAWDYLSGAIELASAREEKLHIFGGKERQTTAADLVAFYCAGQGHSSPGSSPTPDHSQNAPPILQTSAGDLPHQNHDGGTSYANQSLQDTPIVQSGPDIELNQISSRDVEDPAPPDGHDGHNRRRSTAERAPTIFSLPLCGAVIFLAPANIVSGMTASHGDNWKLAFVGFFMSWLVIGTTLLYLDLRRLQRLAFTKRCLWHLTGCAVSLYFFISVLHITSNNLPQWLPTIIDCGVGMSLGFQNIPTSARHRIGESISDVVGGIFGGTQVIVRRDEDQLLPAEEQSSSRRRRMDLDTSSMV